MVVDIDTDVSMSFGLAIAPTNAVLIESFGADTAN